VERRKPRGVGRIAAARLYGGLGKFKPLRSAMDAKGKKIVNIFVKTVSEIDKSGYFIQKTKFWLKKKFCAAELRKT
jgi:hypothetical protein